VVNLLPGSDDLPYAYEIAGRPADPKSGAHSARPGPPRDSGYFRTMQIPPPGRALFDETQDRPDQPMVALVDEMFARRHFGGCRRRRGPAPDRVET